MTSDVAHRATTLLSSAAIWAFVLADPSGAMQTEPVIERVRLPERSETPALFPPVPRQPGLAGQSPSERVGPISSPAQNAIEPPPLTAGSDRTSSPQVTTAKQLVQSARSITERRQQGLAGTVTKLGADRPGSAAKRGAILAPAIRREDNPSEIAAPPHTLAFDMAATDERLLAAVHQDRSQDALSLAGPAVSSPRLAVGEPALETMHVGSALPNTPSASASSTPPPVARLATASPSQAPAGNAQLAARAPTEEERIAILAKVQGTRFARAAVARKTASVAPASALPATPSPQPQELAADNRTNAALGPGRIAPSKVQVEQIGRAASLAYIDQVAPPSRIQRVERMAVRMGGEEIGAVRFQVNPNRSISVHLGQVLDLFEDRFDPAKFAELRNAAAGHGFVTLDQLGQAGIAMRYDPVYDEMVIAT